MNPIKQANSTMHFKSAQISGVEISPNDMAQINRYALSPLSSEDVFAFKVSMAANEIDRDFEVFPRHTLSKLASLFVGKTVVKDHEHKSDNQIARIFATDLVESQPTRMTRAGEVLTELIAKCYMVKTSTNADLIAEIRAGIRKEVSLGCHIGKAICSVCETDNVKTYCVHFPGKEYEGETCYFSLEQPRDAYELSFVAIPAQQHAGTVKSYGEKPCRQEEMEAREKALQDAREVLRASKNAGIDESRSTEGHEAEEHVQSAAGGQYSGQTGPEIANEAGNDANVRETDPETPRNDAESPETAPNGPQHGDSNEAEQTASENPKAEGEASSVADDCEQQANERGENPKRLTVNQDEGDSESDEPSEGEEPASKDGQEADQGSAGTEANRESADEGIAAEKRQALNQLWEAARRLMPAPTTEEQCRRIAELFSEFEKRLTVNQKDENPEPPVSPTQESSPGKETGTTKQEAEEALKAKQAEARLRALGLALSLRRRDQPHQKNGGHHE